MLIYLENMINSEKKVQENCNKKIEDFFNLNGIIKTKKEDIDLLNKKRNTTNLETIPAKKVKKEEEIQIENLINEIYEIDMKYQTKLIYIFDFFYVFEEETINFSFDEFIKAICVNARNNPIFTFILNSLSKFLLDELKSKEYEDIYDPDKILFKYICENTQTSNFIQEVNNEILSEFSRFNKKLKIREFFSYKDKIDYLCDIIYQITSSEVFRKKISEKIEKKSEILREKQELFYRIKEIDNHIKGLNEVTSDQAALKEQISQINEKLSILEKSGNTPLSETTNQRQKLERGKEEYEIIIKEQEEYIERKKDIMKNVNKIKHLLYDLGTINGKGKKLGKDRNKVQYFFFPWQRNSIILKTNTNWKIIKYNNSLLGYFQQNLSSKENNEFNLLKQIENLIEKQYFCEIEKEKFVPSFSIPLFKSDDMNELIVSRLLSLDENFSSLLKKKYCSIWEEKSVRNELYSWLLQKEVRTPKDYGNYISIFYSHIMNPYKYLPIRAKDMIIDINNFHSLIDSMSGKLIDKPNPELKLNDSKVKLFSKEEKDIGIDLFFKDYISNIKSEDKVIVAIYILEALYNSASKRDKEKQTNRNNFRRTKWDDVCMKCGKYGDLICCETCSHVIHFYCTGLKREPEQWFCETCVKKRK